MLVEGNQMGRIMPTKANRIIPTAEETNNNNTKEETNNSNQEVNNNQEIVKK
jgi:hypothetical protein